MLFFDTVDSKYHLLMFIGIVAFLFIMGIVLTIGFNRSISDSSIQQDDSNSRVSTGSSRGLTIFVMVIMILFMISVIIANRNNKVYVLGFELNKGMIIYIFIAFLIMFSAKINV